jgi:hypothetical protein
VVARYPGLERAPLLYRSWACTTGDVSDFLDGMIRSGGNPRAAARVGFADPELESRLASADDGGDPAQRRTAPSVGLADGPDAAGRTRRRVRECPD